MTKLAKQNLDLLYRQAIENKRVEYSKVILKGIEQIINTLENEPKNQKLFTTSGLYSIHSGESERIAILYFYQNLKLGTLGYRGKKVAITLNKRAIQNLEKGGDYGN
jgi:hypothetical protein